MRGISAMAAVLCVSLLIVLPEAPVGSVAGGASRGPHPADPSVNLSLPELTVSPSAWWMVGGSSLSLNATWSDVPPGCELAPAWYRWATAGPRPVGTLDANAAASTNFTAATSASGTNTVTVVGAANVACGPLGSTVVRIASANVTVDALLVLRNLTLGPNPIARDGITNLTGSAAGGVAPYQLRIDWGDGNVSSENLSTAGGFSIPHRYFDGAYVPTVVLTDSSGLATSAIAPEAVAVGNGPEVAIAPSTLVAEVDLPVTFAVTVVDPPMSWSPAYNCGSTGNSSSEEPGSHLSFTCTFATPGATNVSVRVLGIGSPQPIAASAVLRVPVVAPLSVAVVPSGPAEAGGVAAVRATVSGGVPPFRIAWQIAGNASSQSLLLPADGVDLLPVWPVGPGAEAVSVEAVDGLGVPAANDSARLTVADPVSASAVAGSSNGTELDVTGGVRDGLGPFDWAVAPDVLCAPPPTAPGTLSTTGGFEWDCRPSQEGPVALSVVVVDSGGHVWHANETEMLAPRLALSASVVPGPAGFVRANVSLAGGLAPFSIWINASSGSEWSASGVPDGTASWVVPIAGRGPVALGLTAVDALGFSVDANFTPILTPSASAPGPAGVGPVWELVGGLGAVGGLALVLWRWRGRRSKDPPAPGPDPDAVLRRIIEPSDGVDRATVELLAEEEGVSLDVARATVDRWIANGTVRAGRGSDGEEILAWSAP